MYGVLYEKVLEGTSEELERQGCDYIVMNEKLAYKKAFYNIIDYTSDYAKIVEEKAFSNFPDYKKGKYIIRRLKIQEFDALDDYDTEYAQALETEIWGNRPDYVKGEYIAKRKGQN
jgi:coproporphyrinogen III oxidase